MNLSFPTTDDIIKLLAALEKHPFATLAGLLLAGLVVFAIRTMYPHGRR